MNVPKPVKLASGSWRIQIQTGGKRHSITCKTKKEVIQKAKEIYAGYQLEERSPLTVGKAFDKYIESKDCVLSPSTILAYKRYRTAYLQNIMAIPLSDLTQEDVQRCVNEEYKSGKSPKTLRNAHGLLSAVLRTYRPTLILRTTLPQKTKYEVRIFTEDEMLKVWEISTGTEYEIPILLASWLGMRMSEILGLRYEDIIDGKVHIHRAIVRGENGEVEKPPKSISGDRWIKCPDEILNIIGSGSGRVVPMTSIMVYKGFLKCCDNAGVKPCRFHDLRHFAASEAHSLGVPDKYLMRRMGHKTDNMLKTTYEHVMRDKEESFSDLIDAHMSDLHTKMHTKK